MAVLPTPLSPSNKTLIFSAPSPWEVEYALLVLARVPPNDPRRKKPGFISRRRVESAVGGLTVKRQQEAGALF